MATKKRRSPAKKAAPKKRTTPRRQPSGGGSGVGVRGSASASASVGNGWFKIFDNFSLIRFGGSGGGGSLGGGIRGLGRTARKGAAGFLGAVQGARTGSKSSLDGVDEIGCVDCGGGGFHAPGCSQAEPDDYTIDVEVIDDRPALGPGGVD
jgi:hypothetical protein